MTCDVSEPLNSVVKVQEGLNFSKLHEWELSETDVVLGPTRWTPSLIRDIFGEGIGE